MPLRQKSANHLVFEDACDERHMLAYFRMQKTETDFELLDLRQLVRERLKYDIAKTVDGTSPEEATATSQNREEIKLVQKHRIRSFFQRGYSQITLY